MQAGQISGCSLPVSKVAEDKMDLFISNAIQYDERDGIYPVHYDENYRVCPYRRDRSERIYVKGIDKSTLYPNWSRDLCGKSRNHTVIHTGSGV